MKLALLLNFYNYFILLLLSIQRRELVVSDRLNRCAGTACTHAYILYSQNDTDVYISSLNHPS